MSTIQPPAFPARLLKRMVPAQDHEVLLGDLAEEYQRGRSTTWYWLQICAAVVIGTFRDVRTHPLLALRAIAVGLLSFLALVVAQLTLRDVATGAGFMWDKTWIGLPFYWHWPYYGSWSFEAFREVLWLTSSLVMGWIVARTHRHHGITMVLVFLAGFLAFRVRNFLSIPGPVVGFSMTTLVRDWIIEGLLILIGGYLATPRERRA